MEKIAFVESTGKGAQVPIKIGVTLCQIECVKFGDVCGRQRHLEVGGGSHQTRVATRVGFDVAHKRFVAFEL